MNEMNEIKILYQGKEYVLNKQQLDRTIALATKQLRKSLNGQLQLEAFSILRGMEKPVKVLVKGHESELYREMNPELVYAIESGLLDSFEKKQVKKEKPVVVYIPKTMTLPRIKIVPLTSPVWKIKTAQDRIFYVN